MPLDHDAFACRAILECKFAEDLAELRDLRFLDDTARIAEPEEELLKAIDDATIDQLE